MKKVTTLFSTAFIAFEITFLISCSDRSSGSYVYPKIGSENNSVLKEWVVLLILVHYWLIHATRFQLLHQGEKYFVLM